MMKTIYLTLAGTTAAKKIYVPLAEKCRIIAAKVVSAAAQTTASTVKIGLKGATHPILTATLTATAAAVPVAALDTDSVTETEQEQIFGPDTPIELISTLSAASQITIELQVDPFLIGQRQNG